MKKIYTFIFCLFFLCVSLCQTYDFTKLSAPYTNLTAPVSINGSSVWSSFSSYTVPLGFSFNFMGTNYTSINMEGSGFTFFDPSYYYLILPFCVQLEDKGTVTSLSPLSYKLEGVSPTQILKIEWQNCAFADEPASTANFQLWLYETSNMIEIHIGTCTVNTPSLAYSGNANPGPSIGIYRFNSGTNCVYGEAVQGTPPSELTVPQSGSTNIFNESLSGTPAAGTVYRFQPYIIGMDESKNSAIQIYPNPTNNLIQLKNVTGSYKIFNSAGELVFTGATEILDLTSFDSGIYYFVTSGQEVFRVIKQ